MCSRSTGSPLTGKLDTHTHHMGQTNRFGKVFRKAIICQHGLATNELTRNDR